MSSRSAIKPGNGLPCFLLYQGGTANGLRLLAAKPQLTTHARQNKRLDHSIRIISTVCFPPVYHLLKATTTNPLKDHPLLMESAPIVPAILDPWDKQAITVASTAKRRLNPVKRVAMHYSYENGPGGQEYRGTRQLNANDHDDDNPQVEVQCLVTSTFAVNRRGPGCIAAAHLLPRSLPDFAFHSFGISPQARDCMRNLLPMCEGIEKAFDAKQITFRRISEAKTDNDEWFLGYKMIVLDEDVMKTELWKDATAQIGDFADQRFWVRDVSKPYTSILDYHYQVSLYSALQQGRITLEELCLHAHEHPTLKANVPRQFEESASVRWGRCMNPRDLTADSEEIEGYSA